MSVLVSVAIILFLNFAIDDIFEFIRRRRDERSKVGRG